VQSIEKQGKVLGYVFSGCLTKKPLAQRRMLINSPDRKRTKGWRGDYMEMA
jgi:hypothetical protein